MRACLAAWHDDTGQRGTPSHPRGVNGVLPDVIGLPARFCAVEVKIEEELITEVLKGKSRVVPAKQNIRELCLKH